MPNKQLLNYIKTQLNNKTEIEKIKIQLIQSGWKFLEVENAIQLAQQQKPVEKKIVLKKDSIKENTKKLKTYIEKSLNSGQTIGSIKLSLEKSGWDKRLVNKTIEVLKGRFQDEKIKEELLVETQKTSGSSPDINLKKDIKERTQTNTFLTFKEHLRLSFLLFKIQLPTTIGFYSLSIMVVIAITLIRNILLDRFSSYSIIINAINWFVIYFTTFWSQTAFIYSLISKEKNILNIYKDSFRKNFTLLITVVSLIGVWVTGAISFLIPALIFSVWFSFSAFITIEEGVCGAKALSKSREYVKRKFGVVFGRNGVFVLINLMILFILKITIGELFVEQTIFKDFYHLINLFIQSFFIVFFITYNYILFSKLKDIYNPKQKPNKLLFWITRFMSLFGICCVILLITLKTVIPESKVFTKRNEISLEKIESLF